MRKHKSVFAVGSKVWFGKLASLTAGLYSVWEGPIIVTRRVGAEFQLLIIRKGEKHEYMKTKSIGM